MNGKIKTLKTEKGFGFIMGDNNIEYFFHHSAVKNGEFNNLEEGQQVTFEDADGERGPRADDVFVESR